MDDTMSITENPIEARWEPSTSMITAAPNEIPSASRYRAIVQRKIDEGARRAAEVITTIQRDQPRDQILRMRTAGFDVASNAGIRVRVGEDPTGQR